MNIIAGKDSVYNFNKENNSQNPSPFIGSKGGFTPNDSPNEGGSSIINPIRPQPKNQHV